MTRSTTPTDNARIVRLSEQLRRDHESGDFGLALEGYAERAEALESEPATTKADLARAREEERERIMVLFRIVEHAVHEDSWCQECALENVIPAIANFRAALNGDSHAKEI